MITPEMEAAEDILTQYLPFMREDITNRYCPSPRLERVSPIGDRARRELIELLVALPNQEGQQLWRWSGNLAYITANEATHRALDRVYHGPLVESSALKTEWAHLHLTNLHNAMAARNRLRIVAHEYRMALQQIAHRNPDQPITVLSIAAGSSRALLETTAHLDPSLRCRLRIRLVDISKCALQDGAALAASFGIDAQVELRRAHFLQVERYLTGISPDLVVVKYCPQRRANLPPFGYWLARNALSM